MGVGAINLRISQHGYECDNANCIASLGPWDGKGKRE